jgi:hypothetical protein
LSIKFLSMALIQVDILFRNYFVLVRNIYWCVFVSNEHIYIFDQHELRAKETFSICFMLI